MYYTPTKTTAPEREPQRTTKTSQPLDGQRIARTILKHALLLIGGLIVCVPLIWMLSAAIKPPAEILTIPVEWVPSQPRWENFSEALATAPFVRYFFNSVWVSSATTFMNLLLCSLAGYGFARYQFPFRNALFLFVLGTFMIPFQVLVVPLWTMMRELGLLNTTWALILPGIASAFGVFLMRQFISQLPEELMDAARIDGASEFGIWWRIVIPLSASPLIALAIFIFLESWGSLLWPLTVITKEEYRTLALGLTEFQSAYGTQYHLLMAASTLLFVPAILAFFALQRYFVEGATITGING